VIVGTDFQTATKADFGVAELNDLGRPITTFGGTLNGGPTGTKPGTQVVRCEQSKQTPPHRSLDAAIGRQALASWEQPILAQSATFGREH
jgi:hypothetical protein